MQAPVILATLLGRFEVELDEGMGGVEGMLARQCNTFSISIDQVAGPVTVTTHSFGLAHFYICKNMQHSLTR